MTKTELLKLVRASRGKVQAFPHGDHMDEQEFYKDCESICFECGKPSEVVIAEGVGLCAKCYEIEQEGKA